MLSDGTTPGFGITVPTGTDPALVTALEMDNTFTNVEPGNEVVVLVP
jgi:hypothetical protein